MLPRTSIFHLLATVFFVLFITACGGGGGNGGGGNGGGTTPNNDTTPEPFSFLSVEEATPSTAYISESVTVAGINAPAAISITGGEYSINGGDFTSVAGEISNGDTVTVRQTSSTNNSTTTLVTLTIGGVEGTYSVTTTNVVTTPEAYSFLSVEEATPSTAYISESITVAGINAPAAISITGGEYSINGGDFTAVAGEISNGDTVTVRQTSSANTSTTTLVTLTIGGVEGTYSVTTTSVEPIDLPNLHIFNGETYESGREVWGTDGSLMGTYFLKELNTVGNSGCGLAGAGRTFVKMQDTIYYVADDGINGTELWKTDSEGSTTMVKNFREIGLADYYAHGANFSFIKAVNNQLFIGNNDGLWVSDGTGDGTVLITPQYAHDAEVWNNLLYFRGSHGNLWKSDGSSEGTVEALAMDIDHIAVADDKLFIVERLRRTKNLHVISPEGVATLLYIQPEGSSSRQFSYHVEGNVLYFLGNSEEAGWEIWRSDGTEDGTNLVKDQNPGVSDIGTNLLFRSKANSTVYAVAYSGHSAGADQVYITDGTSEGTSLAFDLETDLGLEFPSSLFNVVGVNGYLYFTASDSTGSSWLQQLWRTDGTLDGTEKIMDENSHGITGTSFREMKAFNNMLLFSVETENTGKELWKVSNNAEGVELVKDINLGSRHSDPRTLTAIDNQVYFEAYHPINGCEPWVTDGTENNTRLLADINQTANASFVLRDQANLGSSVLFSGGISLGVNGQISSQSYDSNLWTTDGTPDGTQQIEINPEGYNWVTKLTPADGFAFFTADDGSHGRELWRSDGTTGGTELVSDITPGEDNTSFGHMLYAEGKLYMVIHRLDEVENTLKAAIWMTDGTEQGTLLVHDFNRRAYSTIMKAVGDNVFVPIRDEGLYVSNGIPGEGFFLVDPNTESGSLMLPSGCSSGTYRTLMHGYGLCLAEYNGLLYFMAETESGERGLWSSDGTQQGTQQVLPLASIEGWGGSSGNLFAATTAGIFYTASDEENGNELWVTDGTEEGTHIVADLRPGTDGTSFKEFYVANDTLFFKLSMPCENESCRDVDEIWASDGTTEGTINIIGASLDDEYINFESAVNGLLYFTFNNSDLNIHQYWRSDGTEAGTTMLHEYDPELQPPHY